MSETYTRTRSRGSIPNTVRNGSETWWDLVNGAWVVRSGYPRAYSSTLQGSGRTETMSDVVTPGWRKASARGDIIVSPMVQSTYEIEGNENYSHTRTTSTWKYQNVGSCSDGFPYWGNVTFPSYSFPPNLAQNASNGALAQVSAADLLLPVTVAEMGKTIEMIGARALSLVRARQAFLSGRLADAATILGLKATVKRRNGAGIETGRRLRDSWLEYRYGWRPLYFDAQGAVKALHSICGKPPLRQTARGYAEWSEEKSGTSSSAGGDGRTANYAWNQTVIEQVRAGIIYEAEPRYNVSRSLGVSLFEAPSVAWELVPYSFVVDWFVDVGTYLQAIKPKVGVNYRGRWVVDHRIVVQQITCPGDTFTWSDTTGTRSGFGRKTTVTKNRTPSLSAGLPSFNPHFSISRTIDAISLLSQLGRR